MNYSFVIPTRGELKKIIPCVESIRRASGISCNQDEVEIIIINTGKSVLNDNWIKLGTSPEICIVNSTCNNVSRARNTGIQKSRGKYVVLIDDDAYIDEEYFNKANNYLFYQKKNCICGKLINPVNMKTMTKYEEHITKKSLRRIDYNLFRGTCIIIEKSLIESVGYYDVKYGPGGKYYSAEESDLFFRLKRNKVKVIFVGDVIIYHPIEEDIAREKVYRYSYATGKLLINHMIEDKAHAPIYMFLIIRILMICQIRMLQRLIFPSQFQARDNKHRYLYVIKGIAKSIFSLKDRKL